MHVLSAARRRGSHSGLGAVTKRTPLHAAFMHADCGRDHVALPANYAESCCTRGQRSHQVGL
eukprot:350556-Chlamydomonas_euryale.AAC.10